MRVCVCVFTLTQMQHNYADEFGILGDGEGVSVTLFRLFLNLFSNYFSDYSVQLYFQECMQRFCVGDKTLLNQNCRQ